METCQKRPIIHIFEGHVEENRTIKTENRLKDINQEKKFLK